MTIKPIKSILSLFTLITCLFCHVALYAASNIAPSGTAYGWSRMTSSTANTGQVPLPGLNDNDLVTDVDIQPDGDRIGAWEAAGIIWPQTVSINSVDFINGRITREGDGFLTRNCTLQFSTNGTTWTNSGWTINPTYPNNATAGGKTYTFSGPAVSGIKGARVVGQVRTTDTSYHWIVKQVRVIGNIGANTSYTISTSAGANGSINPSSAIVPQGSNQSFTITASSGYNVEDVKVDGVSVGAVNNYTFSNVQANHLLSASFKLGGTACTAPPATPTGLASPSQTTSTVNLAWNAVSTPNGCAVTYNVYKGGSLAATVSTPNTVIQGLTANTQYSFAVAATNSAGTSAISPAISVKTATSSGGYTPAQILSAIQSHMTSSVQVNTLPHINTMTRSKNVNVYQVTPGVFAYTSSMAIDTDGSDPDPDPDHQNQTTFQDSAGAHLGSHHVAFYVLGDTCATVKKGTAAAMCPHFYYPDRNIKGLQFALIFYNGKVIGSVFGDTQGTSTTPTSDNDSRELGEASVQAADMLGIPSSGTTGGVNNGVTVVIFSGPEWVVKGTNKGTGPVGTATGSLNGNAQALVQKALDTLGAQFGL